MNWNYTKQELPFQTVALVFSTIRGSANYYDYGHIIQVQFENNGGLYLSKIRLDEEIVEDVVYVLRDGGGHYDIVANRQRAINKMVEHAMHRSSDYNCPIQKQTETKYFVGQYVHAVEEFRVQD